jgi:hypothetical protein
MKVNDTYWSVYHYCDYQIHYSANTVRFTHNIYQETFGAFSVQPLRLRRAVKLRAAVEVEHTVHAVLGRALASAPVQLLPQVVVAGDVASLDAPHLARRRRSRCPTDLAEHDERCTHLIKFRTRHQKAKHLLHSFLFIHQRLVQK